MGEAPEQLIDTVLRLVPDAAVVVDGRGTIVAVNDRVGELFGYGEGELVGEPIETLVPERFRDRHRDQRSDFQGDPHLRPMGVGLDLSGRRRDSSEFPVDISLAPVRAGDRTLVVAAVRDVTERRAIEAELRRLLAASERHARWQAATSEIRLSALNGVPLPEVLDLIVQRTAELMDVAAVALVRASGEVVAGAGPAAALVGTRREPPDRAAGGDPAGSWDGCFSGAVEAVPVTSRHQELLATLYCEAPAESDGDILTSMAEHVSMAEELERARADQERLLLADERGRIARDLHDHAVQSLFATGLNLQGLVPLVENPRAIERLHEAVDALDETIKQIRTAIFTLSAPAEAKAGVRATVVRLAAEAARGLGFEPAVLFDGPVDVGLTPEVATQVTAVVREALANVARHAAATAVSVEVRVTPSQCEVRVVDDGVGFASTGAGRGLTNLGSRAAELGGRLDVDSEPGRGTRLAWRVPLG